MPPFHVRGTILPQSARPRGDVNVRNAEVQIDRIEFDDPVLTVRCSGHYGIGSAGKIYSELLVSFEGHNFGG